MSCTHPSVLHLGTITVRLINNVNLLAYNIQAAAAEGKAEYLCLGRCLVGNTAVTDCVACAIQFAVAL